MVGDIRFFEIQISTNIFHFYMVHTIYIRALDIYIYDQNQTEPIQNEVDVSFPTIS